MDGPVTKAYPADLRSVNKGCFMSLWQVFGQRARFSRLGPFVPADDIRPECHKSGFEGYLKQLRRRVFQISHLANIVRAI